MKIFIVVEGEFNGGSSIRGVYSSKEQAIVRVVKCKQNYWIKDAKWEYEYLSDQWINGIDYIQIETWELDGCSYNDNI